MTDDIFDPESLHSFHEALVHTNIHAFTHQVFNTINPGASYDYNWHIGLIMERLEEVQRGNIKRLIINMPPRSLKSVCASVAFPAWVLAHQPHKRIITASYSLQLAKKHSLDCRNVIQSDWYQQFFPETRINREQHDKLKFQTSEFGFRLATSVGGTLTGEGGDIIIIDDPLNAAQAQAPALRQRVNDWYQQTLVSRLDDKSKGSIVLVMQRFNLNDLTGYLLKNGNWQHLCLPLIATKKEHFIVSGETVERQIGEVLHSKRDTLEYAEKLKAEIGNFAFEAQYQQNPITQKGEMIKPEWFIAYNQDERAKINDERYNNIVHPSSPHLSSDQDALHYPITNEGTITQSWDTAIKSAEGNDYSVCITACLQDGISYILDITRNRIEYPELKKRVIQQAERFSPNHILIEDKASGQQLIQDLKGEHQLPIIPIQPKGDKFSRISAATGMIEAGKVALPEKAHWLGNFLHEALNYPNTSFDDQIDALAQYLNWLRNKPKEKPTIRTL